MDKERRDKGYCEQDPERRDWTRIVGDGEFREKEQNIYFNFIIVIVVVIIIIIVPNLLTPTSALMGGSGTLTSLGG